MAKKLRLGAAQQVARIQEAIGGEPAGRPLTGSRGGRTTVTDGGLLRKTAYFSVDEWEAIRRRADADMCSAAEVVRRAARSYLGQ